MKDKRVMVHQEVCSCLFLFPIFSFIATSRKLHYAYRYRCQRYYVGWRHSATLNTVRLDKHGLICFPGLGKATANAIRLIGNTIELHCDCSDTPTSQPRKSIRMLRLSG
jgi:hypothetical protein